MAQPIGRVKEPKMRKPTPADMEISSVSIEPADNGFMVSTHYRLKKESRESCYYPEGEKSVFNDASTMAAHVAGIFGAKKS